LPSQYPGQPVRTPPAAVSHIRKNSLFKHEHARNNPRLVNFTGSALKDSRSSDRPACGGRCGGASLSGNILRRAGYEVLSAANGIEAIKVAHSAKIDAVVTDALMPHLNGHELCRYLRARPELAHLPLLLLTGLEPNSSAPSTNEHADAHLTKPVRPEVLTGCLASLLHARN
jgi:CheY-like chemotaxis protein